MRHPDDPDIAPNSKAAAAFCLGVLGAVTGLVLGGLIPATIALLLARQARADIDAGAGLAHRAPAAAVGRSGWPGPASPSRSSRWSTLIVVRLLQNAGR